MRHGQERHARPGRVEGGGVEDAVGHAVVRGGRDVRGARHDGGEGGGEDSGQTRQGHNLFLRRRVGFHGRRQSVLDRPPRKAQRWRRRRKRGSPHRPVGTRIGHVHPPRHGPQLLAGLRRRRGGAGSVHEMRRRPAVRRRRRRRDGGRGDRGKARRRPDGTEGPHRRLGGVERRTFPSRVRRRRRRGGFRDGVEEEIREPEAQGDDGGVLFRNVLGFVEQGKEGRRRGRREEIVRVCSCSHLVRCQR
mmetsp:Transcript_27436/g.80704  ORF Transcript_27436/g.80704 Transcript_27436/m.80704 type:complete len:247 (-) Transcript_27436:441-1181(-)